VNGASTKDDTIEGARSRLRPILMTSFAMLPGWVPLALGLGEGGEQSAPLGRGGDRRSPRRNLAPPSSPAGDLGHAPVAGMPGFQRRSILTTHIAAIFEPEPAARIAVGSWRRFTEQHARAAE